MKKIIPTFILLFFISACGGKVNTAVPIATEPPAVISEIDPKVTPVCISSEPTQDDIDRALSFTDELFTAPEWVRSYTVSDGRVSVYWSNGPLRAIIYVEALIFPCGYEEPDINNFFSDENWQIIFADYQSFEAVSACKTDNGLRLYEFKAIVTDAAGDAEYMVKYWVMNDTDTRVMGTMIVFPIESQSLIDENASALFPDLTSCP
ncbi:MAG: hypothetical protein H7Y59_09830 [Anaerolineales bacterium]|nr:hypothetical protein [Anaerolineales bacterium]